MLTNNQITSNKPLRIIKRPTVLQMTGFSKSTLYNRNQDGTFPPAINLGGRSVGFVQSECELVLQAMIAGYCPEQLQALVKQLVANRTINLEG